MSSSSSQLRDQIETPNPVELFWEKNRRFVIGVVVVIAGVLGVRYALEYMQRQRTDELWSGVAVATNLDRGYSQDGSSGMFIRDPQYRDPQFERFNLMQQYLQSTHDELITRLGLDIAEVKPSELDAEIEKARGTEAEPLLIWVAALRGVLSQDWDAATARLDDLEQRFPNHFLCAVTEHPPQFQPEIPDGDKPGDGAGEEPVKKRDQPEYAAAVAGSPVTMVREQIDREVAFRAANPRLYDAPEPDPQPTVVVTLDNDEEFEIRFYREKAPLHVDHFLARVREKFYDGQAIDEVWRPGDNQGPANANPLQLHFGLASTKDQDDRSKWTSTEPSDAQLEFESNDLSHFPGMVAAATESDGSGKSSGDRVWINATDAAKNFDGQRVIFGRVTKGLEAVQWICEKPSFTEDAEKARGQGRLQQTIRIVSMTIRDDPGPVK